ncbi:hypothetical protein AGRI_01165 [Alishewanella agri BL06]|uniref:Uncharacterized protein n=1 Tax=Alishewanella agri BL06 TaxID=1195246 RepID=I9P5Y2_9ALTE|nr:hypothetical protein AGRI_01165 [Alishewanella agri BL06]
MRYNVGQLSRNLEKYPVCVASKTFVARQRADIAKQSVYGMDAGQEPTGMYLRRLCVQYRLQAAWRFD